jgi:Tol biopolymer transport system component
MAVGCGRIHYDPVGADNDGGTTIDANGRLNDAAVPPEGPFGVPTPIASLNSGQTDVDPSVTADGLQLFFNSNRTGNFDIYASVRNAMSDAWPAPAVVDSGIISTGSIEQNPAISADGLTLYFTRSNDIFQAKRATPLGVFFTDTATAEIYTGSIDTLGSISPDERTMTFFSGRSGGQGGNDIYIATRPDLASPWTSEPMPGAINSADAEVDSFLSPDGLTLHFDSDRSGGLTDYKIYVAQRADVSDAFGAPALVDELNIGATNGDSWLTADGKTIYFSSGSFLNLDIHEATR